MKYIKTKISKINLRFFIAAFALILSYSEINAQSVSIEKATASGCYFYGGNSKSTISVQVGWNGASNGDLITVSLDGGASTRTIYPQSYFDPGSGSAVAGPIVTPQVIAFEIDADGGNHTIQAVLSGSHSAISSISNVTSPGACAPMYCAGTALGGTVFFDNNANGIKDAGEIKGIENVTITAFDKNGISYTATSDANGKYAFSTFNSNDIPTSNFPIRIEFSNFPTSVQGYAGPSLNGNYSNVRFVNSPSCGIDCGGVNPLFYSQNNPPVFSNLYTSGDPLGGGDAGANQALIAHSYFNTTDFAQTTIATAAQVGSLFAHSWNKYKKRLFTAALLKRHVGLGPLGLGGIYTVDYSNPSSPIFSNFIDVTTLGINIGQSLVPSNAARGLNASKYQPSTDVAVYDLIGKVGIGGMDLSDDGNKLYFMNLYDNHVYAIDLTTYFANGTLPTAANVTSFAVPDPGCVGGQFHAFSVKVNEGKLYVGMVCDGSSSSTSNMVANIKALNLTSNTWSDVFDFPLTYPRGYGSAGAPSATGWYTWQSNPTAFWNAGAQTYPTPILSDIEFDLDGSMVIALMDRTSNQTGSNNYDDPSFSVIGNSGLEGGDVLRAFYSNGAYVLENNAKAGPNVGYAPNNNQGPGFGEFYHDAIEWGGGYHTEMATGGLTLVPGSGEVMIGMVDPAYLFGHPYCANGYRRSSNSTGAPINAANYYSDCGISTFGKGNGMGDIEAASDNISYIEIGNYVWNDANGNGIQDPTEIGIPNVQVSLYNTITGAFVKSTSTDANGNYYFSTLNGDNLQPNTQYTVVMGGGQFSNATNILLVNGINYNITLTNTGQGANATLNDNNFNASILTSALGDIPANLPKYEVTTGEVGYVNHSIDFGLTNGSIGNYVWADDNNDGIQNEPVSNGINGVTVNLLKDDGTGNFVQIASITTTNDVSSNPGYYSFPNLVSGSYKVQFPTNVGNYPISGTTTQTAQTDLNNDANSITGLSGVVVINTQLGGLNKDDNTIDAGYKTNIGSIGNYVWYDGNNDGSQNEPTSNGINGITVNLLKNDGLGNYVQFATTTTSNDGSSNPGYYNFLNLNSGDYKVEFPTSANGSPLTSSNQSTQSDGNSDAGNADGLSASIVINTASGNALDVNNPTIDAGYIPRGSLGNYVWYDLNNDGLQNETAANGINGVTVNLLKDDGSGNYNQVATTTTANDGSGNLGYYNFNNLLIGNYKVQFPSYIGSFPLGDNTNTTAQTDGNNDANSATGLSDVIAIVPLLGGLDKDNPTIDAGYRTNIGSLGNYVWYDDNNDGLQNESSSNGVNGVTVNLLKDDGTGNYIQIATTTTANDGSNNPGYYSFNQLFSGNYKVEFPTAIGTNKISKVTNQSSQVDGNNDANSTSGMSGIVVINTLLGGVDKDNPTIDAGYFRPAQLGNYVWNDINKDGNQDANEVGVAGITVTLYDIANTIIGSTITDAYGYYLFNPLAPGNYHVGFTLPSNYVFTSKDAASDVADSDVDPISGLTGNYTLVNGDSNMTVDAGIYFEQPTTASVGNFVWFDTNHDGIQDSGEEGISGVTVTLCTPSGVVIATTKTDANGFYLFSDVTPGTYAIGFTAPVGLIFSPNNGGVSDPSNSDANPTTGKTSTFSVVAGDKITYVDAGFYNQLPTVGGLGDRVWYDVNQDGIQDVGENGVAGVTVTLYQADGVTSISSMTTDAYGNYIFNNLPQGQYVVGFSYIPANYILTNTDGTDSTTNSDANQATGKTNIIYLAEGQFNMTYDAGIYTTISTNNNSLGNYVWNDANKDGIQDATEQGVAGVTATLYDNTNTIISITATDATGYYLFPDLPNGVYHVGFSNIPVGYGFSTTGQGTPSTDSNPNQSTGLTGDVALTGNTHDMTLDAGIAKGNSPRLGKGTLGDLVWYDMNNDGLQSVSEAGVPGVIVTLYQADGTTIIKTTTTDAIGNYIFTSLDAGSYVIGFSNLPSGFTISAKYTDGNGLNGEKNSDVNVATLKTDIITLGTGEDKMSVDMGINPPVGTASLGDKVWIDLNTDGLQTTGDPGVPGISVALYDNTNTVVATTTTDANGEYHFVGLTPGDYSVGFSNLPSGYTFTTENIDATGINGSANSDANATTGLTSSVALAAGDNNLNLDAGIKSTTVASVGDYVWLDINRDGIQDPSETGIGGVLVTLYDNANNPVASTITRPDGGYLFTNVTPGTYTIGFTNIPTGLEFTIQETDPNSNTGSNANPSTGITPSFTVLAGTHNPTIDAGLTTPLLCGLGDYVWIDVDQNGQQDAGEPVVAGALVTLYAANGTTVLATASTDGNGTYSFVNLPAGSYIVGFGNVPSITKADGNTLVAVPTAQNIGSDAGDNDMGTNGRTGTYTLIAGEYNPTVDAGFKYQFALGVKQLEATSVVFTNEVNCNVNWFTVEEVNAATFNIERSIDNVNFESVGTKACVNNTIGRTNYSYQDNIEAVKTSSIIYYRIRLNDIDGKQTFSNVIALKNKLTSNEVLVYPIPFRDVITIDYPSNGTSTVSISLFDLSGRVLRTTEKEVVLGVNTFTINDVNSISSGTYYVKIIDELTGEVYIKKLVK